MLNKSKYHALIPHSVSKKKESIRSISLLRSINTPMLPSSTTENNFLTSAFKDPKRHSILNNPRYPVKLTPISEHCNSTSNNLTSSLQINKSQLRSYHSKSPQKNSKGKISIKKALINRDWLLKAKASLLKEFSQMINLSNGIVVSQEDCCYKFYIGKGNNSALVKQVLMSRWWWSCANEADLPNVNLVWRQNTDIEYLATIPIVYYRPKEPVLGCPGSTGFQITYETENLENLSVDISSLNYDLISKSASFVAFKDLKRFSPTYFRTHNRLEMNQCLSDKKSLYKTMKFYYETINDNIFNHMPLTFHIENSSDIQNFRSFFTSTEPKLWIIKPGENSNRGNGIFVSDNLTEICSQAQSDPTHSYVIQQYIEKPYLLHKRKFDIRVYSLVTSVNGVLQCYFYKEGYLRTASKEFTTKQLNNKFIHLTNDAVQKTSEDYGKFENGNKLSYSDFQRYLDSHGSLQNFYTDILPRIKSIVKDSAKAAFLKIDRKKRVHSFEIFGYDFLLDHDLKPWLIEVNTNPCLELSSSILVRLIPAMIENAVRIAIDPVFPEPTQVPKRISSSFPQEILPENKFELIFHEFSDGESFLSSLPSPKREKFLND